MSNADHESASDPGEGTVTAPRIVIIGGGLAGAKAAVALREGSFEGSVTIVGDESHPPYERPPLSKEYLQGGTPAEDMLVVPASGTPSTTSPESKASRRCALIDPPSRCTWQMVVTCPTTR